MNKYRQLAAELRRSRQHLVPPAYQTLWEKPRFSVWYGGRSAAKSWSIARVLLVLGNEASLRILCCREIQGSIKESAYRLLADQINILELDDFFEVQADCIIGRNGSRFFFEGLRYNAAKIRSYEGVDIVWVEEAQNVSELSWETLLPTIRKRGSRFYISFNPMTKDDPVLKRWVGNTPPNSLVKKVGFADNPHLSPEADAERLWLEKTDYDAYRHVWLGEPRTVSDALILKGKFEVAEFEVNPAWSGPHFGVDFGFARDPSAAVRCFIDDDTRTLYVTHEFWALATDIDALPRALEATIPGISRHVVFCDSSRPETVSYLARNGIPSARSAEKWPGSVDDGIAYLRAFACIVIDPACKHLLDECGSYSFKTDRLTGVPLPQPEDKSNHLIDALRYALSPLIRSLPTGGYFSRAALLDQGEPVGPGSDRAERVFMTVATCARAGTAVGLIFWAHSPHHGYPLQILDYELAEIEEALDAQWLTRVFAQAQQLREVYNALEGTTAIFCETGDLFNALAQVIADELLPSFPIAPPPYDLFEIHEPERMPATLDERAERLRASVNGGRFVKLAHSAYTRQLTHRSVSANHLTNQVLGFRPGLKDQSTELTNCFALGCLASLWADGTAPGRRALVPPVVPAAPVGPPPMPTVLLSVGPHEIDGVLVNVTDANGGDFAQHPIAPGRHVVDSRVVYAHPVGCGIRVSLPTFAVE